MVAPVSLRVNPDVDAKTHPYISTGLKQNKFGVAYSEAVCAVSQGAWPAQPAHYRHRLPHRFAAYRDRARSSRRRKKYWRWWTRWPAEGIRLEHIDLGGGLGIRYNDEMPPAIAEYVAALLGALRGRGEKLILEPGRVLVGNAGVLLTQVEYLKHGEEKNFAIVDAAMNDLMRPALYDAFHEILPVKHEGPGCRKTYEVVGPVCETGDFLGHARESGY